MLGAIGIVLGIVPGSPRGSRFVVFYRESAYVFVRPVLAMDGELLGIKIIKVWAFCIFTSVCFGQKSLDP
ncbi:MAG TPA: hypothetical protein VE398_08660 [Acidobacteriota bacterium]|nr:hypothetical protein [Acidobacteriota bacterium]